MLEQRGVLPSVMTLASHMTHSFTTGCNLIDLQCLNLQDQHRSQPATSMGASKFCSQMSMRLQNIYNLGRL